MVAMVALFPTRQFGIELGSILLIFTGQVWNMTFSFYSSLKSIPREMREVAVIYRWSWWQRFTQMELPYATIGLVWNSMMSVAGGWFFLMACEMFVLGDRDLRLARPGLLFADSGERRRHSGDHLGSRHDDWSDRADGSIDLAAGDRVGREIQIRASGSGGIAAFLRAGFPAAVADRAACRAGNGPAVARALESVLCQTQGSGTSRPPSAENGGKWIVRAALLLVLLGIGYAFLRMAALLSTVSRVELRSIFVGAGATFLRVEFTLLLAALWTIPAGVIIGLNPRLSAVMQPIAQIAASVPATALFPIILLLLIRAGGGLGIGSIVLLLLGTQWYILFNVIAGASAIPTDLKEVCGIFQFGKFEKWRQLLLPGIFPYLVTGLVTASGGAWNASIVAEYFHFHGQTFSTTGLGAVISGATDSGNFRLLLAATLLMAAMVVTINRFLWRRLYVLASTKYKLEA